MPAEGGGETADPGCVIDWMICVCLSLSLLLLLLLPPYA